MIVQGVVFIPSIFVFMRLFAVQAVLGKDVLALSFPVFAAWTVILFMIPCVVMAIVPKDDVSGVFVYIIALTGDLPIGLTCYMLPPCLYLMVFEDRKYTCSWFVAIGLLALGAFVVVASTTSDTLSFVTACLSSSGCSSY